jgi:putative redox protein
MDILNVKVQSLDDKIKFGGSSRDNPQVTIDYPAPLGTGQGYTSLELLMISFGTCISSVVLTVLRGNKMNKTVHGLTADVQGVVRGTHPKALESILLTLRIKAADLTEPEVRQVLAVAEEKLCPVWAMIKGNVEIETRVEIENE